MADYDLLLLGISTWDFGEIQEIGMSCGTTSRQHQWR